MLHHIEIAENTSAGPAETRPLPTPPAPVEGAETAGSLAHSPDPHLIASAVPRPSAGDPQPSTLNPQPLFPRSPGETPRAFGAFLAFFQLGQARSHQAVADKLGESLPTVKRWASRYNWSERLHAFYSGLLQAESHAQAALQRRHAAEWAGRLDRFREQEWDAAQKLIAAAQCFLESFGEEDLHKMNLAQVSRALKISSAIGRQALAGIPLPESSEPEVSPAQQQLLDAVKRIYGQALAVPDASSGDSVPPQPPCAPNSGFRSQVSGLSPQLPNGTN